MFQVFIIRFKKNSDNFCFSFRIKLTKVLGIQQIVKKTPKSPKVDFSKIAIAIFDLG